MNLENLPVCEHGIPAHAVSAWRDGDQPASEAERVAAHLAECPSSQARVAEYDALTQVLRAQREPLADDRLWRAVRMRINQTGTGTPAPTGSTPRRLIGSLATLAAVLALLLSFALLLGHGLASHRTVSTTEQATATSTTLVTSVPGWSRATIPSGFTLSGPSLAIAPSDGNIAYACVTAEDANQSPRPGLRTNQIWVTHDRGAHWHRMTDPPGPPVNQCFLQVDSLNPAIVEAWGRSIPLYSTAPAGTPPTLMANGGGEFSAITFNGGVNWQQPTNDPASGAGGSATSGGTTYAVRCCYAGPSSNEQLLVSRDGMRSWTPVDAAIVTASEGVQAFSYRPDTGELLAQVYNVNTLDGSLWESGDGGAHWSELPIPAINYYDVYVTQQPVHGQSWHLCVETYKNVPGAGAYPGPPTGIVCSEDGGHHWTSRPLPAATGTGFTLLGITNNGDLLAESGGSGADRLYRLPAGSDQWQNFDTPPGTNVSTTFVPSPSAGVLWAVPVPPSFYSPFDPTGRIYTKDYAP
jgi:hypothetical protein